MVEAKVVLPKEPVATLADYLTSAGGRGITRAWELGPERVVEEIDRSGLRGRGGAGFPTGQKWQTVRGAAGRDRFAVCNAAEGEPGTFKDRALLRANPYQVLEGLAIAAFAIGAREVFIALKASFEVEVDRVTRAVTEIEAAGLLGDLTVSIVTGPEEYLFGEEKALLEVIEGHEPLPRWLPPYMHGLFATAPQLGWESHDLEARHHGTHESNPTLVNNVETLANATHVLANGADWFRSMGTAMSPGTVLVTLVGDVGTPQVIEVELGTPLRSLLTHSGAPRPGRVVKAVLSGVSNAVLGPADLDVALSYETLTAVGSGLGSAGLIVYDDTACMVEVAATMSRFLAVESCGQCPPCKIGTGAITASLDRLSRFEATTAEMDNIHRSLMTVSDANRCFLPVEEQQLIGSLLRRYPEDFAAHLEGRCPAPRDITIPKIVDITDGRATYDERQARKRPDWTYAP
jgi:NADH:ubiquinone oxidoreductase subunit F (NADH-binding)